MKPLLPRLIMAHVAIMILYASAVLVLPFPDAYVIIIATLIVAPIGSAIATGYLLRMWLEDALRPRSELFGFLAYGAFVLTMSLLLVGALAVVRITADLRHDPPYLSPEVTTSILGLSFMLVGSVPIMKGILFFRFYKNALSDGVAAARARARADELPVPDGE